MIKYMQKCLRAFGREDSGTATIEFCILFPTIMALFLWAVDLGMTTTKAVMLEFGVDVVMRDLRLGNLVLPPTPTAQATMIKNLICDRVSILQDCRNAITMDMQIVSTSNWNLPAREVSCVDRSQVVQPAVNFVIGQQNDLMIVKVCVKVKPMFPNISMGLALHKDAAGEFALTAVSTFANEPT